MIRTFPRRDLQELIRTQDDIIRDPNDEEDEGPSYKLISAEATTKKAPGHDDLGVWGDLYFEVEGVTYWCRYVDGCRYWKDNSGDRWDHNFPMGVDAVPCTAVEERTRTVTITEWVPLP